MTEALRVLLVEDSPTDAKLVTQALRRLDRTVEVERVETATQMRAALQEKPWDIVISDWSLPSFGARAALEILKESKIDLPFIIVSGTVGEDAAVEAMRAGAHDYVLKDNLARLVPAVERELREGLDRAARRASEAALAASEARYRRIVETTNQGVWMVDPNGRTTFMNRRMADMLGYSPAEVVGMPAIDFVADGSRAAALEDLARAGATPLQVERELLRKDRSTMWGLIEAAPSVGEAGRVEGAIAMVIDVTERRKAEDALRASEARLRGLWDSSLVLIAITGADGHILDINEAGAEMLGYTRAELLSRTTCFTDLTPAEWRPLDDEAARQLSAAGVASPWEKELVRKDGSRVSVLTGVAALDGNRIGIAIDVTEKKRAQSDVLERVRLGALTAEVGMALAQADSLPEILQSCAEAMVTHLDAALARIWTLNPQDNVLELRASAGLDTHIDGPHGRVPAGALKIGLIAEDRRPYWTDNVLKDPRIADTAWAAREGLVSFAGYPLLVAGQVVGVVAMFGRRPLSEPMLNGLASLADAIAVGIQRKVVEATGASLEAQLRQAQKMEAVGRLAGGIAHDFNNVLSVILSYGELILQDLKPGDPLRADIGEIHKAGVRAADLTRQLLMFSRQQVIEPKVHDLNDVLASMDKMLRRLVGEDVEVTSFSHASSGCVRVDLGSIEQVVMNLAVNARDAMPAGGKLTLETANVTLDETYTRTHFGAKPGPHVMLAVTDSGTGIDPATLARIFEPFFTTKDAGKGTGLGLSTVFGIVQQSGGSIWVYSELDLGTTFKIYLPVAEAGAQASRPPPGAKALRGSETILLVEDEPQVRAVTRGILQRHGYTVVEALDPAEALLLCESRTERFDLLLTDVVMPGMSGPELARRVAQLRPGMKVLCMSGYTDNAAIRHDIVDAAFAYLQKPLTVEGLTRKVRDVLDADRGVTS